MGFSRILVILKISDALHEVKLTETNYLLDYPLASFFKFGLGPIGQMNDIAPF